MWPFPMPASAHVCCNWPKLSATTPPPISPPRLTMRHTPSKPPNGFFHNRQVDLQSLLHPHYEATGARIAEQAVVLAIQDTTSLTYDTHAATTGLGPINTRVDGAQGLKLHDTLAGDGIDQTRARNSGAALHGVFRRGAMASAGLSSPALAHTAADTTNPRRRNAHGGETRWLSRTQGRWRSRRHCAMEWPESLGRCYRNIQDLLSSDSNWAVGTVSSAGTRQPSGRGAGGEGEMPRNLAPCCPW